MVYKVENNKDYYELAGDFNGMLYNPYLMKHFYTYVSEILSVSPSLTANELSSTFEEWTGIRLSPLTIERRMRKNVADSFEPPFFECIDNRYKLKNSHLRY